MGARLGGLPVVVVGLGVMGASVLWGLAREGVRAVGIDALPLGHTAGGSHGGSRLLRRLHWEGPHYPAAADRSRDLFEELERESGRRLLKESPQVVIGPADGSLVGRTLAVARRCGTPCERLTAPAARREFPGLRIDDHETVLLDPRAAIAHPEHAVRAMIECAVALGAEVVVGAVAGVAPVRADGAEAVRVTLADGMVEARAVVVATGSGLGLDGPVPAVPGIESRRAVQAWFRPALVPPADRAGGAPAGGAAPGSTGGPWPAVVRQVGARRFWSLPDVEGRGVKVGGPSTAVTPAGQGAPAPGVLPEQLGAVEETVRDWFPGLTPSAVDASTAFDGYTRDADFVVGPLPGAPSVVVCGGLSGHGFTHAPVLGAVVAARLAASATGSSPRTARPLVPHDDLRALDEVVTEHFSPRRLALHDSASPVAAGATRSHAGPVSLEDPDA
jgi:sarcosine oxidase